MFHLFASRFVVNAVLAARLKLKMLDGVREMRRLPVSVGLRHRPVQKLPARPTKGRPSRDGCSQRPFSEHGPSCAGTSGSDPAMTVLRAAGSWPPPSWQPSPYRDWSFGRTSTHFCNARRPNLTSLSQKSSTAPGFLAPTSSRHLGEGGTALKQGRFNGLCCPVEAVAAKPGPEP